jgi:hypothetical protein
MLLWMLNPIEILIKFIPIFICVCMCNVITFVSVNLQWIYHWITQRSSFCFWSWHCLWLFIPDLYITLMAGYCSLDISYSQLLLALWTMRRLEGRMLVAKCLVSSTKLGVYFGLRAQSIMRTFWMYLKTCLQ